MNHRDNTVIIFPHNESIDHKLVTYENVLCTLYLEEVSNKTNEGLMNVKLTSE